MQLRVLLLRLLLQCVEVGTVGAGFRTVCIAVWLELIGPVRSFHRTDGLLGSFFQLMYALHADVIILMLRNLSMYRRTDRFTGCIPNSVLQLGCRARLFCAVFHWNLFLKPF